MRSDTGVSCVLKLGRRLTVAWIGVTQVTVARNQRIGGGSVRPVSTPRTRARWVRGALVGTTSALVTTGAHCAAGGGMPRGAALVIALLVCATVGALCASARSEVRWHQLLGTAAALAGAQLLGHVAVSYTHLTLPTTPYV